MNFFELINKRESCRGYEKSPIDRNDILKILEAGRLAPSACNSQPWKLIAVDDESLVRQIPPLLQGGNFNQFTDDVPAFIVICETKAKLSSRIQCDSQFYAQMDIGIAVSHLTLAAQELNIGSCIIGYFDEDSLKKLLNIPEEVKIRLLLTLGLSKSNVSRTKSRKPMDEITSWNAY